MKEKKGKKKQKYVCENCGAGQPRKYIEAMRKAGFALWHLACRECGQSEIIENDKK